jgi:hypothetical protein
MSSLQVATTAARRVVGITGAAQVVFGLLLWTGHLVGLLTVHMAIGLAFVLAFWALAALAGRARVRRSLVFASAFWGLLVLALGIGQQRLLPGSAHWTVKVLHLAAGLIAMALAARLTAQIRRRSIQSHARVGADSLGAKSSFQQSAS